MATYVITGANRGIGYEYSKQLTEPGDEAIALCRTPSPEWLDLGIRVESNVDITFDESVVVLAQGLQGSTIDALINNAGILERASLEDLDFDSIRQQFEVNCFRAIASYYFYRGRRQVLH